jgi:hypothetical protein
MSRSAACLASMPAFLLALAVLAVSASACEGGGGGPELTSLSAKLSGEGKEGEELTVLDGAKIKDKATLSGKNASKATGKVTYKIYSDKECKTLVTTAGEVTVSGESIPASSEEELEGGHTYYWQAHYGGDANNAESTSPCTNILTVKPVMCTLPFCEPTITPGVQLNISMIGYCTAGPIMTKGIERYLLTAGHCLGKGMATGTKMITQIVQSAYPAMPAKEMEIGHTVTYNYSKTFDIAEVKIENTKWLPEVDPAVLVEWLDPPNVTSVLGHAANKLNETTCLTGAKSGTIHCGAVLATGVTELGVENLIETSADGAVGDSGAPEFAPVIGGVEIQGVYVAGGSGKTLRGSGSLKIKTKVIKGVPEGEKACNTIDEMKTRWSTVLIEGLDIPPETKVEKCAEEEPGGSAAVTMSEEAAATGKVNFTVGYSGVGLYEPLSRAEEAFPFQVLLQK